MPRLLIPALLSLAIGAADLRSAQATTGAPPSTTRVVYVNAVDAHHASVADLGVPDFVVKEDGKSREVLSVEPAVQGLQVIVLVDDNGTGVFRYGLAALAQRLQGRAELAIRVVANQVQTLVETTRDVNAWLAGIAHLGVRPPTPDGGQLLEGIFEAARDFRRREATRPVIVALTVGGEEQSPRPSGQVLDELWRSGAALHVLFVESRTIRPPVAVGKPSDLLEDTFNLGKVLSSGPRESGGQRRDILSAGAQPVDVQHIAQDLMSQYAITYSRPAGGSQPRKLQVTSPRSGVTVIAPTRVPVR
ncbi:MAG TPA: hypothetical protein VMZ90_04395 [Vicinamibacterales bacterium]|nr:hypothetical protein [Vicinamibacterales bacterium]